jgi:hypothetical protein
VPGLIDELVPSRTAMVDEIVEDLKMRLESEDFRQVQVHGLGVAGRDQGGALALLWADRAAPARSDKRLVRRGRTLRTGGEP